jgi:hypothetical protein
MTAGWSHQPRQVEQAHAVQFRAGAVHAAARIQGRGAVQRNVAQRRRRQRDFQLARLVRVQRREQHAGRFILQAGAQGDQFRILQVAVDRGQVMVARTKAQALQLRRHGAGNAFLPGRVAGDDQGAGRRILACAPLGHLARLILDRQADGQHLQRDLRIAAQFGMVQRNGWLFDQRAGRDGGDSRARQRANHHIVFFLRADVGRQHLLRRVAGLHQVDFEAAAVALHGRHEAGPQRIGGAAQRLGAQRQQQGDTVRRLAAGIFARLRHHLHDARRGRGIFRRRHGEGLDHDFRFRRRHGRFRPRRGPGSGRCTCHRRDWRAQSTRRVARRTAGAGQHGHSDAEYQIIDIF